MTALISPFIALRYELHRMAASRAAGGAVLLALLASAVLTFPAAQYALGPGHPHGGAWVVAGGVLGVFLPAPVAACAAGWIGASCFGEEFRRGTAAFAFTLLPGRGAVVVGKCAAAALAGAVLAPLAKIVAFGVASAAFRIRVSALPIQASLIAPTVTEVGVAAGCGVAGVLVVLVLRWRAVATPVTAAGAIATYATMAHSASPVVTRIATALQPLTRLLPGVYTWAFPAAGWVLIAGAGLLVIRRRRIGQPSR